MKQILNIILFRYVKKLYSRRKRKIKNSKSKIFVFFIFSLTLYQPFSDVLPLSDPNTHDIAVRILYPLPKHLLL